MWGFLSRPPQKREQLLVPPPSGFKPKCIPVDLYSYCTWRQCKSFPVTVLISSFDTTQQREVHLKDNADTSTRPNINCCPPQTKYSTANTHFIFNHFLLTHTIAYQSVRPQPITPQLPFVWQENTKSKQITKKAIPNLLCWEFKQERGNQIRFFQWKEHCHPKACDNSASVEKQFCTCHGTQKGLVWWGRDHTDSRSPSYLMIGWLSTSAPPETQLSRKTTPSSLQLQKNPKNK